VRFLRYKTALKRKKSGKQYLSWFNPNVCYDLKPNKFIIIANVWKSLTCLTEEKEKRRK
jgi:hypothetical protein